MNNKPSAVQTLRASLAYHELGNPPSILLPFDEATEAGVPFSIVFSHEGIDWAVFVMGDCDPMTQNELEKIGAIDAR